MGRNSRARDNQQACDGQAASLDIVRLRFPTLRVVAHVLPCTRVPLFGRRYLSKRSTGLVVYTEIYPASYAVGSHPDNSREHLSPHSLRGVTL